MRAWIPVLLLAALALLAVSPVQAAPLGLAWGVVAEPAVTGAITPGAITPGQVAEHLEFLQAHGWQAVRGGNLGEGPGTRSVLLSFDDPASALRYVVPLLELYQMPALVTVGPVQAADPALEPVLKRLAASPWIELVPRVEAESAGVPAVRCEPGLGGSAGREEALSHLSSILAAQVARLREVAGVVPAGVAWAPGTWSGPGERVAAGLGLTVQLPTFAGRPPVLDPPRVARYAVPSWAGIWALVQAGAHWDPRDHPVRFLEVDAAWICAGGDPNARVARIVDVVQRLGLNGVRLLPGGPAGAWFPTTAAPVRGDVAGPLARALHDAGVRWVIVDLPAGSGDPGRDVTLALDLSRAVDAEIAVLPATSHPRDRLDEAVLSMRPSARLAWSDEGRAFHFAPAAPGQQAPRGATVSSTTVAAADAEAAGRAVAGWEWIGLPVELAEEGVRSGLRSLAAFALPR
jgi:hypothetical protein